MEATEKNSYIKTTILALELIWDFGWLRPQELAKLLWKDSKHGITNADYFVKKWEEDQYILVRKLPNHSGRAIVLSQRGALFLYNKSDKLENKVIAKSGKNFGSIVGNGKEKQWKPPLSWKHDLMANSLLVHLAQIGHDVIPEKKLRRERKLSKYPDGVILDFYGPGKNAWLEIESARKTGENMRMMIEKIIELSKNERKYYLAPTDTSKENAALIAYVPNKEDEIGYAINYRKRIINAIKRQAKEDVSIYFAELELTGYAVSGCKVTEEFIENEEVTEAVLKYQKEGYHFFNKTIYVSENEKLAFTGSYKYKASSNTYLWQVTDNREYEYDNFNKSEPIIIGIGRALSESEAQRRILFCINEHQKTVRGNLSEDRPIKNYEDCFTDIDNQKKTPIQYQKYFKIRPASSDLINLYDD